MDYNLSDEVSVIKNILPQLKLSEQQDNKVQNKANELINVIRKYKNFSVEEFMNRFSIDSDEGMAVISLIEALLRIPDNNIAVLLISDKLAKKHWSQYIFKHTYSLKIFLASLGLSISGAVADVIEKDYRILGVANRIGQVQFIKLLKFVTLYFSSEFVFAEDIRSGTKRVKKFQKYKFSFDLLGESARCQKQADRYYEQYNEAIDVIGEYYSAQNYSQKIKDGNSTIVDKYNLSIKLTALCPRFELKKFDNIKKELLPKVIKLIQKANDNNISITFDAEELYRFDIYWAFIKEILAHKDLKDCQDIGLVIQAYHVRAYEAVIDIIKFARDISKKIPIRLVKGAYWDTEIKHAQEIGMKYYPVFTVKEYTDANYVAIAKKMLENNDIIFPQFATHNALTVSMISLFLDNKEYEFQKLYGMGNVLHDELIDKHNIRIYAPVGNSNDLLAYLMRRIIENGANTSFVNKVRKKNVQIEHLVYNLYDKVVGLIDKKKMIKLPEDIYSKRKNAMGYDLGYKENYNYLFEKVSGYYDHVYEVGSIINGKEYLKGSKLALYCPANHKQNVVNAYLASKDEFDLAINSASDAFFNWSNSDVKYRSDILNKIADALEKNKLELYALLIKEAGKSIDDAVNEVVEAVDFCRYYANEAIRIMNERILPGPTGERNSLTMSGCGVFVCISPWNFPLAIFTGQIVGALVSGNSVIAKPAEQTMAVANYAVKLMHKAGIPESVLQLVFAEGEEVGKHIIPNNRVSGVAFTGSNETAMKINSTLLSTRDRIIPFIAETGGQNAMIVDSSALLEQVVDDVMISAFYSAGQRCSALRILYVQDEIYDKLFEMLVGAMNLLQVGDNSDFSCDVGPVIDNQALKMLEDHIVNMKSKKFNVISHESSDSKNLGSIFYPHIIEVGSINDIESEKFGPILHIAKYDTGSIDKIVSEINNSGFALTFGIHSRIESRIKYLSKNIQAGNIYANRSIVGAKVETQPFGGFKKSGTGFKAGGPHYLLKFMVEKTSSVNLTAIGGNIELLNLES